MIIFYGLKKTKVKKPLSASLDATNIAKLGAGIGTGALVMGYAVCKE